MRERPVRRIGGVLMIAFCVATTSAQQPRAGKTRKLDATVVVRYDAKLIRLSERLVEALITEDVLRNASKRAIGSRVQDIATRIRVRLDQHAHQPAGVFVATLVVTCPAEFTRKQGDKLLDAIVGGLRTELSKRLGRKSWNDLRDEIARLDMRIRDLREEQRVVRKKKRRGGNAAFEDLRSLLASLNQGRREVEVELDTEEAGLAVLQNQLRSSQTSYQENLRERQNHAKQLLDLESRISRLRLDLADGKKVSPREIAVLQNMLTEQRQQQEAMLAEVEKGAEAVSRLGTQFQTATLQVQKLRQRLEATKEQLGGVRGQLDVAREAAAAGFETDAKLTTLAREIAVSQDRRSELAAKLASLRTVRVSRW